MMNGTVSSNNIGLPRNLIDGSSILINLDEGISKQEKSSGSSSLLSSFDSVAKELSAQIESQIESVQSWADYLNDSTFTKPLPEDIDMLEVEGRLGTLIDTFSNDRLNLPIETESLIVETKNDKFSYRFAAGVSVYQFESLVRAICESLRVPLPFTQFSQRLGDNNISQQGAQHGQHGGAQGTQGNQGNQAGSGSGGSLLGGGGINDIGQPRTHIIARDTLDIFCTDSSSTSTSTSSSSSVSPQHQNERASRFSYLINPSTNEPSQQIDEAIRKDNRLIMNIYTGADPHEADTQALRNESGQNFDDVGAGGGADGGADISERSAVDYRIAINFENKVPPDMAKKIRVRTRRRIRRSFPLYGCYRVDASIVTSGGPDASGRGGGPSRNQSTRFQPQKKEHEIELEMNPAVLIIELKKKLFKKDHKFDIIVSSFVQILKSWCSLLNSPTTGSSVDFGGQGNSGDRDRSSGPDGSGGGGKIVANLSEQLYSKEQLEKYQKYISKKMPLIGDYLYRVF